MIRAVFLAVLLALPIRTSGYERPKVILNPGFYDCPIRGSNGFDISLVFSGRAKDLPGGGIAYTLFSLPRSSMMTHLFVEEFNIFSVHQMYNERRRNQAKTREVQTPEGVLVGVLSEPGGIGYVGGSIMTPEWICEYRP